MVALSIYPPSCGRRDEQKYLKKFKVLGRKGKMVGVCEVCVGKAVRVCDCTAGQWIFNQGWGGFLEEEVLVEAEEARPAVGLEGSCEGTHCQHPHPEEDSSTPAGEQLEYQQGGGEGELGQLGRARDTGERKWFQAGWAWIPGLQALELAGEPEKLPEWGKAG